MRNPLYTIAIMSFLYVSEPQVKVGRKLAGRGTSVNKHAEKVVVFDECEEDVWCVCVMKVSVVWGAQWCCRGAGLDE